MKLVSARFIGLIGIYRKSGVKDITIDFTKCIHNIIMIIGKNGSGKSTLMHALNPLPDSPQMYLDGEPGMKNIIYADGDILYEIEIRYPILGNGTRGATKAFFREINNGVTVELNENGTVNSFKDIVYSKFNLDSNFMSLSRLSMEDRGIVDKKPNERKKYIGNILESVEVYNDIYKALVKRSGVFKSMINSISAKIDTIGDENKLTMEINAINNRISYLENDNAMYIDKISESKAKINVLDPDKTIEIAYHDMVNQITKIKEGINLHDHAITTLSSTLHCESTQQAVAAKYKELQDQKNKLSSKIDSTQEQVKFILTSREEDARQIIVKSQKLSAYQSDINITAVKAAISQSRMRMFEQEKVLKEMGLTGIEISKDEYIIGLNTLNAFRDTVLNIKSYASRISIIKACDYILSKNDPVRDKQVLVDEASELDFQMDSIRNDISYNNGLVAKLSILESRPSECTINTCAFIKDALDAKALNPEAKLAELNTQLDGMFMRYKSLEADAEAMTEVIRVYNDISNVIRSISNNRVILNKLPNGNIFSDTISFINRIKNGDNFNDIYEIYKYIDQANILELYKAESTTLMKLEADYKVYETKIDTIDELSKELEELNDKVANIDKDISNANALILDYQKQLSVVTDRISDCDMLINLLNDKKKSTDLLAEKEMGIGTMLDTMNKISNEYKVLTEYSAKVTTIKNELTPLYESRDKIRFSLTKLDEYKQEIQLYSAKYNQIELIKKYSSPTKGIQTIFMELYMNNTLTIANRLLGLLFDGQLELLQYEINDNEFRIPCKDNITSIINDDISSCSSAEKSMISMILSFALLHQSSSKFNIPQLDEIDAMLDQWNKSMFPTFLHNIMGILDVEMCLMISHSSEIDLSDVDVIQLTPANNEKVKGNVIFTL